MRIFSIVRFSYSYSQSSILLKHQPKYCYDKFLYFQYKPNDYQYYSSSKKSNKKPKKIFLKSDQSNISAYYRLISPDSKVDQFLCKLTHWNRAYFGYSAPTIVFFIWGFSFLMGGLYLLKQSFTTEGFTRSYTPGEGGDVGREDWNLIDMHGKKVCKQDFVGKYTLIYFGFTFCPDVCPIEMQKLADFADIMYEKGMKDVVIPIFVSVDYRRDSPAMIEKYVKQYSDKVLGLCGSRVQMENFARCMKTYFSRPPELEEDYILEHSTYMYFTGTDGAFKQVTSTDDGAKVLANKVCRWIAEDRGKIALFIEKCKQIFD